MRIIVTAIDQHPVDGHPGDFRDALVLGEGKRIMAGPEGVFLDGVELLRRDRRMKSNRIPGHPYLQVQREYAACTGFAISVESD